MPSDGPDARTPAPARGPDPALPSGVALTAVAMARERQVESRRDDRLFDDPWAGAMVAEARDTVQDAPSWLLDGTTLADIVPGMVDYVAVRTRWIDDQLADWMRCLGPATPGQVVLLGSGLDTRPLRLERPPGIRCFVLDFPATVGYVQRVLASAGATVPKNTTFIGADLTGDWAGDLREGGLSVHQPTVWVVEGVLMYLNESEAGDLVTRLRALCGRDGHLLTDLAHPNIHHNGLFRAGHRRLGENSSPIRCAIGDPVEWLAARGWTATVVDPTALSTHQRRAVPPALDPRLDGGPMFWFVEGTRG